MTASSSYGHDSAQPNTACIFPWKYNDEARVYKGCANPDEDGGGDWCPTELNDDGEYVSKSGKWGYCRTYENWQDIPNFTHTTTCWDGYNAFYYADVDGCIYWYDEEMYEIYYSGVSCEDRGGEDL